MNSLRLVFAGSPAAAAPSLRALATAEHDLAAVITREDSRHGRRGFLTPTPVSSLAEKLGIKTIKTNRLTAEVRAEVAQLAPDLGVIVAYGGLVTEPLLSTPRLGWINLHFSLLPRWRGAAPVQRAIIAGDERTGASVFQLVAELDAGDVFGSSQVDIGQHETAGHLLERLALSGSELLLGVVNSLAAGTARSRPQRGDVTLAPKLRLEDGRIDWTRDSVSISNLIRGVTPEPGAFTTIDAAIFKIVEATIAYDALPVAPGVVALSGKAVIVGTSTVPIELVSVLPAGKKAMAAGDWLRGRSTTSPTVFD